MPIIVNIKMNVREDVKMIIYSGEDIDFTYLLYKRTK